MAKPKPTQGLHHVALTIKNFSACQHFYVNLLGMEIVWQPDDDNLYLSTGSDNLALHRASGEADFSALQRLDHIGFFLSEATQVDEWYEYLKTHGVNIRIPPKNHRDGTKSFYCEDPDGNLVQMIYYPFVKKIDISVSS